jgi:hypothetical protein
MPKGRKLPYFEALCVFLEDFLEVELLDFFLQATGETRVHGRASREDNVLVEIGARVQRSSLDRLEEKFCSVQRVEWLLKIAVRVLLSITGP